MHKRSLTLSGHRTSIALEPEFWQALERMAAERDVTVPQLISDIDETRTDANLSSALRVHILSWALNHS